MNPYYHQPVRSHPNDAGPPRAVGSRRIAPAFIRILIVILALVVHSRPAVSLAHEGEQHAKGEEHTHADLMPTNEMCPVMPENKVDPEVFVEYEGKRVYLCCAKCKKKFLEAPELYLVNLPRFAKPKPGNAATSGTMTMGDMTSGTMKMANIAAEHDHESMAGHASAEAADHKHADASTGAHNDSETMEERHDKNIGHKHNHAADHGQPVGMGRIVRFAGKFHPAIVHFPIALILMAAFSELLGMILKREFLRDAAFFLLSMGTLSGVIAVALGWSAGAYANFPEMEWVFTLHRWLGASTGALALIATAVGRFARRRNTPGAIRAYRTALFTAALLVGITGHFGSALIYGLNHFTF